MRRKLDDVGKNVQHELSACAIGYGLAGPNDQQHLPRFDAKR